MPAKSNCDQAAHLLTTYDEFYRHPPHLLVLSHKCLDSSLLLDGIFYDFLQYIQKYESKDNSKIMT